MGEIRAQIERLRSVEHADVPQKYLMLEAAITMEKLLAVYEAAEVIEKLRACATFTQFNDLREALSQVQTIRDPEDFNLWCTTHQIPKTSDGCTYPDCDCTVPEKHKP